MRNARRRESAKCAKSNGDPGAIRTRDPQLRRSTRESLKSKANSNSYETFHVGLVPAGDRLSGLDGGELCALLFERCIYKEMRFRDSRSSESVRTRSAIIGKPDKTRWVK